MRAEPPAQLVATLERLGLATAADLAQVSGRVDRLARELAPFDSVWIDALAQARVLTPFQAAEWHAGRGESLRVGPYLVHRPAAAPPGATSFLATNLNTRQTVRLVVVEAAGEQAEAMMGRLQSLVAAGERWRVAHALPAADRVAVVEAVGRDERHVWAETPWIEGRSIAEQLTRCGRFPPEVAIDIARALLDLLADLEQAGLPHGHLTPEAVLLAPDGGLLLVGPGLHAATRATALDDRMACGRLLWQMLCGREPRECDRGPTPDVREFAPRTPAALAEVIDDLLHPTEASPLAGLLQRLGRPAEERHRAIVRLLAGQRRPSENWFASFLTRPPKALDLGPWLKPAGWTAAVATTAAVVLLACFGLRWFGPTRGGEPIAATATSTGHTPHSSPLISHPSPLVPQPSSLVPRPSPLPPLTVHQTAYIETDSRALAPATLATPAAPLALVLDDSQPIDVTSLDFKPGQRVRGLPGKRPVLKVPPGGLAIAAEDVCFENIDFAAADEEHHGPAALVEIRAARAEFCGCTFRAGDGRRRALAWTLPSAGQNGALPTGRLTLVDCVFDGVEAAIACSGGGAMAFELSNVLHLGRGPLVELQQTPQQDEPLQLALARLTLRQSGPLIHCACDGPSAAAIRIAAEACVLAPREGEPLIRFAGRASPERLLSHLTWSGQGSLLAPGTPFALWAAGEGEPQRLDDGAVSVAGLVRSEVEFAGKPGSDPAASRAIRWLAPLPTADAPGIDPRRLPKP